MRAHLCWIGLCAAFAAAQPAHAQNGPVIVTPGRPDVPIIINGVVANGAVVYGDWGLARPGHGAVVIEGDYAYPALYDAFPFGSRGYFPSTGRAPRVGRQEYDAPRRGPRPSTNFYREWSIESDARRPVTEYPPFDPPPIVLAPRRGSR